jgi:hypothetical protein
VKFEEIEKTVREAYERGSIFIADDGNVLSVEGGSGVAAVLAALLETIDDRRFMVYCENQRRLTNWGNSRGNPILEQARSLLKQERKDPRVKALLDQAWYECIGPIVNERVKRGGDPPTVEQARATCAVFVAKYAFDRAIGADQIPIQLGV